MRTNGHGIPIVAVDIDGTLADYHKHFLEFAEKWIGRAMPPPNKMNPGMHLSEFMGVDPHLYRECKLAFRQGGLKRWMPVYAGAQQMIQGIRDLGAEVWICTTRPYLRLDNIDPDTREWLSRNRIAYDAVLFGDEKYLELKRQAGERVAVVFDDLPEQCAVAFGYGFKVCIRDQPYNLHYNRKAIARVQSCYEMAVIAKEEIEHWRAEHG